MRPFLQRVATYFKERRAMGREPNVPGIRSQRLVRPKVAKGCQLA